MARNVQTIRIESILGGHSPTTFYGNEGQFFDSIGIDPDGSAYGVNPNGIIQAQGSELATNSLTEAPMWAVGSPKGGNSSIFIYDAAGSVHSYNLATDVCSGLGDLNDGGSATGNGAAYYDNYIYFARDTTVARYGPLNGTAAFTDDYWVSTLGKTALTNPSFPVSGIGPDFPNHTMHRHSDGKLYFADIVDNQGTLHYIKTTKTTVEGDTDNGSTYDKLQFGYGLWISAIESYGDSLVIALWEGSENKANVSSTRGRAKIAFWDTTSENANQITWDEFPDDYISAIKNVNGVLYILSGGGGYNGFRLSQYIGGNSFQELFYSVDGELPYPGAVLGTSHRILIGSYSNNLESAVSVYSWGLNNSAVREGMFNIMSTDVSSGTATCLFLPRDSIYETPRVGWTTGSPGAGFNGINKPGNGTQGGGELDNSPCWWWSNMFRIGQNFKITKVRVNFAGALTATLGQELTVNLLVDGGASGVGSTYSSGVINASTNGEGAQNVIYRPKNATGKSHFLLELAFTGDTGIDISLPITIEYELIDD